MDCKSLLKMAGEAIGDGYAARQNLATNLARCPIAHDQGSLYLDIGPCAPQQSLITGSPRISSPTLDPVSLLAMHCSSSEYATIEILQPMPYSRVSAPDEIVMRTTSMRRVDPLQPSLHCPLLISGMTRHNAPSSQ